MRKIEEHFAKRPKGLIFHYTDAAATINILQSKILWASQITHLNDSSEFRHGEGLVRERLKELTKAVRSRRSTPPKVTLGRTIGQTINGSDKVAKPIYVTSFSEAEDRLSQWRAYCSAGNGYSLGFDASSYPFAHGYGPTRLIKCVYSQKEKLSLCSALIESWDAFDVGAGHEMPDFLADYYSVLAAMKHSSFVEEQEWRLMKFGARLKLRAGRHGIVPYCEIPLGALRMKRIWAGPNSDCAAAADALIPLVQKYCEDDKNVADSDVDIKVSETPIRQ